MSLATGLKRDSSGRLIQSNQNNEQVNHQNDKQVNDKNDKQVDDQIELSNRAVRVLMLYEFEKKSSEKVCLENVQSVFGKGIINQPLVCKYYKRFSNKNFNLDDLDDNPRPGRPSKITNDELLELISSSPSIKVEEVAEKAGVSVQTIRNHLHSLNYTVKFNKWVPHQLSAFNKYNRIRICNLLLNWHKKEDFFPNLITCDEKWIYYDNPSKRCESVLTNKKVLLCLYWSIYGVEHYEFLNGDQNIISEIYSQHLERLKEKVDKKWPSDRLRKGVFFHQDNARPHTIMNTKRTIEGFRNWHTVDHAPYSPDKTPSDYWYFKNLQSYLDGATIRSKEELFEVVDTFINSRPPNFCRDGIYRLSGRWQQIIDRGGSYLDN